MTEAISQDPMFQELARDMQASMLSGNMSGLNINEGEDIGPAGDEDAERTGANIPGGMPGMPGMAGIDPAKYMEAMNRVMSNPEFMAAATEMGKSLMSQALDPESQAIMELFQNPEHADVLKEKMESLKEDPELKEMMEDIEQNGQGALMKYMGDPEAMAKFGRKFQDIVKDIPALAETAEAENNDEEEEEEEIDDSTVLGATCAGNVERLQEILKEGQDVNQRDEEGRTALHFAAGYGDLKCMEALLDAKADVNAKDNDSNPPLHFAAGYGFEEAAELLMKHGGDAKAVNKEGKTAVEVAELNEQQNVVAVLKI